VFFVLALISMCIRICLRQRANRRAVVVVRAPVVASAPVVYQQNVIVQPQPVMAAPIPTVYQTPSYGAINSPPTHPPPMLHTPTENMVTASAPPMPKKGDFDKI
jgi:hypothetical protein